MGRNAGNECVINTRATLPAAQAVIPQLMNAHADAVWEALREHLEDVQVLRLFTGLIANTLQ